MKVLITRAEPAASQTARNLAKHGHEAILLPLFEVFDTGNPIPNSQYDGIIFTSKNAVETLQSRNWKPSKPNIPVFCVGEKTERAARKLGLKKTYTASGGGAELVKQMSKMSLEKSKVLYLSTPDKSFDMEMALKPYKIEIETVDIYQAKPVMPTNEKLNEAISAILNDYVFIYSALSGEHLIKILKTKNRTSALKECTLIGISSQAVKSLEHLDWKEVLIAKKPEEEQMIALIN